MPSPRVPPPPWALTTGLEPVLSKWLSAGTVKQCLSADRLLPPQVGAFSPIPKDLAPGLIAALKGRGIEQIYTHQARALEAARKGRHVVVSTPTASGKSLCFHLPTLDAIATARDTTALYLYPTKALSRDQEASIRDLAREADLSIPAIVYDGDTPGDARRAARERTSIVMTNPDMLHAGILPHHAGWARMFARLRYVVIDELHTYRGVFGSHVAHVLNRLRRVARFHGSDPTFICATATVGNPLDHASRLLGVDPAEVELVNESGAPRGARHIFMYNPPVVNAELGVRGSYLKAAVRLTTDLLRARVPTLVFGPSRNSVEIMLKYLRDALAGEIPEDAVMAYRGGYLPDTRRRIERGLREGQILGVVATNALELGIDVGDLDAVVCASYPGTIAGTWQRFGRAGRRGKLSAAILVTASHAIDQYLAANPGYLLDGAIEEARIDPSNTEILVQHLKCGAFELPFVQEEAFGGLSANESTQALRFLANNDVLHEQNGRFHWATDKYPANHVSLRSVGWDNTVIIDQENGRTLAELDWRATPTMLHEQAIYQHDGEQYQVERLDHENHKAYVKKVEPDYFTTALTNRKVTPLDVSAEQPFGACCASGGEGPEGRAAGVRTSNAARRGTLVLGEVSVVEKVVGFKKIKFFTHENAGYGDIRLPDIQMHTTSVWWKVPAEACLASGMGRAAALDGLRGILRALETTATIALMCEPRDIGQSIEDGALSSSAWADQPGADAEAFDPTLFLFDNIPGGIGLAARIYERAPELIEGVRGLLSRCECERGCPLCVGAVDASVVIGGTGAANANSAPMGLSRKRAALTLLDLLLEERLPAAAPH